jgi:1-acyl-sn-glycerol-3-phosphate acyltransferase
LTVPTIALAFVMLVVGFPLWILTATIADLAIGMKRLRCVRTVIFLTWMTGFEMVTLSKAAVIWVANFGRVKNDRAQTSLQRLVGFYVHGISVATTKIFGLRMQVSGFDAFEGRPGVICFGHHTSILDSVIPVDIIAHQLRYDIRFVIKKSLAWAPVFDIAGHWLPVHFVDRTGKNSGSETDAIRELASNIIPGSAATMYPEGTFYTPKRLARAVERLKSQDPDLVERAKRLRYVLPPKPGGALAILETDKTADVVLVVHSGFEPFDNLKNIFANLPFRRTVHVHMTRIARSQIPTDSKAAYRWLFDRFEEMDAWVAEKLAMPIDGATRPPVNSGKVA